MSFYGDIKRVQSSPFVFDKYYSSRAEMEENMNTDNVYIGRYVLIKYTYSEEQVYVEISLNSDTYKPNTYYYSNGSSYILATGEFSSGMTYYTLSNYFSKYDNLVSYSPITLSPDTYIKNVYYKKVNGSYVLCTDTQFDSNTDYFVINKSINEHYVTNMSRDVEKYGDTFDGTVWQKIYTNVSSDNQLEKYIMIAELNASVPRIVLDPIAPKYHNSNSSTGESWYEPSIFENVSSEDSYVFKIPDLLKLEIGHMNDNSYAKDLIDPQYRYEMYSDGTSSKVTTHASNATKLSHEQMLNETNNRVDLAKIRYNEDGVTYYTVDDGDIEGKELTIKLYAFGQLLSDLYDALYGKPDTGTGVRPFYVGSPENVLSNYDKGLIGILSSIATDAKGDAAQDLYGRDIQQGMHYYFSTSWNDAMENPDSFIENIPKVIGSASELTAHKSHYKINYNTTSFATATNGNYLVADNS